jgi:hypothetical protein
MARLSKHGSELGRIHLVVKTAAYMSDGSILVNEGFGWRLTHKIKSGYTPADVYARRLELQQQADRDYPAAAAYRRELHRLAGMSVRWKLHGAVKLMPNDPDGVWGEACDCYGAKASASLAEVIELCRLYEAKRAEWMAANPAEVAA